MLDTSQTKNYLSLLSNAIQLFWLNHFCSQWTYLCSNLLESFPSVNGSNIYKKQKYLEEKSIPSRFRSIMPELNDHWELQKIGI
jgi:hypothetical protein